VNRAPRMGWETGMSTHSRLSRRCKDRAFLVVHLVIHAWTAKQISLPDLEPSVAMPASSREVESVTLSCDDRSSSLQCQIILISGHPWGELRLLQRVHR
jgi:hypothetical protein